MAQLSKHDPRIRPPLAREYSIIPNKLRDSDEDSPRTVDFRAVFKKSYTIPFLFFPFFEGSGRFSIGLCNLKRLLEEGRELSRSKRS